MPWVPGEYISHLKTNNYPEEAVAQIGKISRLWALTIAHNLMEHGGHGLRVGVKFQPPSHYSKFLSTETPLPYSFESGTDRQPRAYLFGPHGELLGADASMLTGVDAQFARRTQLMREDIINTVHSKDSVLYKWLATAPRLEYRDDIHILGEARAAFESFGNGGQGRLAIAPRGIA
jgi:hypothetical protein